MHHGASQGPSTGAPPPLLAGVEIEKLVNIPYIVEKPVERIVERVVEKRVVETRIPGFWEYLTLRWRNWRER